MATTGKHLRIENRGTNAQGVTIRGDRNFPEHSQFTVDFPGGEVEITRTTAGDYWAHVSIKDAHYQENRGDRETPARIVGARIDTRNQHGSESDAGDLERPDFYHLAVLVTTDTPAQMAERLYGLRVDPDLMPTSRKAKALRGLIEAAETRELPTGCPITLFERQAELRRAVREAREALGEKS